MAKLTVEDILSRCEKLLEDIKASGGASGNVNVVSNSAGLNFETTQTQVRTHVGSISDNLGSKGESAATSDTGTFSLVALFKRALQNWTALLSRIPAMNLGSGTQAGALRVTVSSDGIMSRQRQTADIGGGGIALGGSNTYSLNGMTANNLGLYFTPNAAITGSPIQVTVAYIGGEGGGGNISSNNTDIFNLPLGTGTFFQVVKDKPCRGIRVTIGTGTGPTSVVTNVCAY